MDLSFQKKKTVGKSISQLLKYVTNNQIKKLYIFYGTPFNNIPLPWAAYTAKKWVSVWLRGWLLHDSSQPYNLALSKGKIVIKKIYCCFCCTVLTIIRQGAAVDTEEWRESLTQHHILQTGALREAIK